MMADQLPLIKQCMQDVKNGHYTTFEQAKIAAGGIVENQVDAITGVPALVTIDPTQQISSTLENIEIPKDVADGASEDGNAVRINEDAENDKA